MKRYLIMLMCLVCMTANAQNCITDLDDTTIAGTWNADITTGDFNTSFDSEYWDNKPIGLTLNDGGYSIISFANGSQWFFKGYWVTTSPNGKSFLHLTPWNSGQGNVNFRIAKFDNGKMILYTYNGNGKIELSKDTSSGVSAACVNVANTKAYTLDGVELPKNKNVKGVIIQGGKKIVK